MQASFSLYNTHRRKELRRPSHTRSIHSRLRDMELTAKTPRAPSNRQCSAAFSWRSWRLGGYSSENELTLNYILPSLIDLLCCDIPCRYVLRDFTPRRMQMETTGLSFLMQQLPYHLPLLLVSLVGLVLSLIFWSRCPGPSLLTLIASATLIVTTAVILGAQNYFISARLEQGWTAQKYSELSNIVSLTGAIVRSLAICMLVIAVFMGRKRPSAGPANMGAEYYR